MHDKSEALGLLRLKSSTGDAVDFQRIDELFSNAAINDIFASNYPHLAEVISNVYQHAQSDRNAVVNWDLAVSRSGDFIDIAISDDGQGVLGSVSKRHLENLTDTSAMKLALSLGSRIKHRGKGLEALARAVTAGQLHSMSIRSGSCLFFTTAEGHRYSEIAHRQGTEVRLTISSNGGRA